MSHHNRTLAAAALAALAATAAAQGAGRGVVPVQPIRGQYCAAFAPPGYAVVAESPQRVGFGADIHRADGRAGVSYSVLGGGPITGVPMLANPESTLYAMLSGMGQTRLRWGRSQPLEGGLVAREYQTPIGQGVVFFRVFAPQPGGFVIVARLAQATHEVWPRDAQELIAVALSMRCQVPMVPAAADPPPRQRSARRKGGEGDSEYNWVLGMETYHDPATGQNYWVSPGTDHSATGPEGAGYYTRRGNATVKLSPGYAQ